MNEKKMKVTIDEVKKFWNSKPLCSEVIPYELGSREYFTYYDKLREEIESIEVSYKIHEYQNFAGKKVLDVGCGNGYVLSHYAKQKADVYGIDITEKGIQLTKKRFDYQKLSGTFEVANAEQLCPFLIVISIALHLWVYCIIFLIQKKDLERYKEF
jgi:2-polyprenyl-3-methyl-5-hydroxy-6-metoxy-1,4-benzoquinol methylase